MNIRPNSHRVARMARECAAFTFPPGLPLMAVLVAVLALAWDERDQVAAAVAWVAGYLVSV